MKREKWRNAQPEHKQYQNDGNPVMGKSVEFLGIDEHAHQRAKRDDFRERHAVRPAPGEPVRVHDAEPYPHQQPNKRVAENEGNGSENKGAENQVTHGISIMNAPPPGRSETVKSARRWWRPN